MLPIEDETWKESIDVEHSTVQYMQLNENGFKMIEKAYDEKCYRLFKKGLVIL